MPKTKAIWFVAAFALSGGLWWVILYNWLIYIAIGVGALFALGIVKLIDDRDTKRIEKYMKDTEGDYPT